MSWSRTVTVSIYLTHDTLRRLVKMRASWHSEPPPQIVMSWRKSNTVESMILRHKYVPPYSPRASSSNVLQLIFETKSSTCNTRTPDNSYRGRISKIPEFQHSSPKRKFAFSPLPARKIVWHTPFLAKTNPKN